MGDGHNVAGLVPEYFDNFVFRDIEEKIILKNSNIERHSEYVLSTIGDSYRAINKHVYANTLQAINVIIHCKKNHSKSPERAKAIAYLHQELKFSPSTIQRILLLFGVKMETNKILKDSLKIFLHTQMPQWIEKNFGGAI